MNQGNELKDKVNRLHRRARLPRTLNKYGPKDHPMKEFLLCQVIYTTFCRSWRRAARFMRDFFGIDLHWTSWQRAIAKWPQWVWLALARASADVDRCEIAAIDGTTLTRSNPSQHYLHRIDREDKIGRPVQQVVMVDVLRRKFLASRIRARPRGEKCDVPYLMRTSSTQVELVLMDKGFDSEPLHRWLRDQGTYSIAPVRKGCRRGMYRKQLRDCFDHAQYWQRNIVESMFSAVKRLFGSHVRARTARTQRAEIYSRMIAYNIGAKKTTT
jgi:hypothetical protein